MELPQILDGQRNEGENTNELLSYSDPWTTPVNQVTALGWQYS